MDAGEKTSNEKRLIDADALLEKMKRTSRYFDVMFDVEEMQTVDAVPVVRCMECKHLMFSDCYGECDAGHLGIVRPDDFCSHGVRKDDAE